jgi:ABC-2 type transport system permease protein
VFVTAHTAYIAVFVLGVPAVTTEFRYQAMTATVLVTPSRWAIVTARLITYGITGAVYALVCVLVDLPIALPWLVATHLHIVLVHEAGAFAAVFGIVSLMALVGLGAGVLMRNQIVAVSVACWRC